MSRETFQRSLGSALHLGCVILLVALVPYSVYAGFWLYQSASSWTGGDAGPLVYALARAIACVILIYALWQLRKTGLRLRMHRPPGK